MSRKMSDETALLRMAIKEVLDNATQPLSANEISSMVVVSSLGMNDGGRVSHELANMYKRVDKPFPLCRAYAAKGPSQYEYYNPDVVKLAAERRSEPRREEDKPHSEAAVNDVNPHEFAFNPVEFQAAPPAGNAAVSVPAGVKSITLTIGGVNIRIELNS